VRGLTGPNSSRQMVVAFLVEGEFSEVHIRDVE
jgi:hypothetical protein